MREAGGKLGRSQLLRHRVRTFANGTVLGNQPFVEEVFESVKDQFGSRRKQGAYGLEGSAVPMFSLRGRGEAIGR